MFAWSVDQRTVAVLVALLTPVWWGMGLLVLAVLGDISPRWRRRVSRLFDRLDRPPKAAPSSSAV